MFFMERVPVLRALPSLASGLIQLVMGFPHYFPRSPPRAVRKPMRSSLVSGERWRILRVNSPLSDLKFPPRTTGLPWPSSLAVHSETLPAISQTPYGLRSTFQTPTSVQPGPDGNTPSKLAAFAIMLVPQGYRRPSVPRPAFSHSSSVGRRRPFHLANA